jgi:hypothetical protein
MVHAVSYCLISMKFLLSITWLLVAAIVNPLCCCLALATEHQSPDTVATHACCSSSESSNDSSAECPHQYEKFSKVSLSAVDSHHITPSQTIGLWLGLLDIHTYFNTPKQSFLVNISVVAHDGSPPGNHQLLCVYLV